MKAPSLTLGIEEEYQIIDPETRELRSYITEILSGDAANTGDFGDGAWVQEVINAVELSFRERRWVSIPLDGERSA